MTKLAVDMQKITVRFGKVIANNEVDFQAEWGEVHDADAGTIRNVYAS